MIHLHKPTDNDKLWMKIRIRQIATQGLEEKRVLDCFAGWNVIWSHFDLDRYYGIDKEKGKGKNVHADNIRMIKSMDLSDFNVIDLDSYGIPIKQLEQVFKNRTLQPGTVIIYTAISNEVSIINKEIIEEFNLGKIYKKVKTLLNGRSLDLFYGYLYNRGIRHVTEAVVHRGGGQIFEKRYGFFVWRSPGAQ